MKRPVTTMQKRPRGFSGMSARSRKEAAIHLVRLEFDLSRLELGAAQADQRSAAYRAEIEDKTKQRAALIAILNQ